MTNEKPGGHGDRAHAAGALDMAVWDAVAKIAGKPLWRLLAERFNGGKVDETILVYPGGGYYYPGKELEGLQGRDARLSGAGLQGREDEDRRRRSRHRPQAHRGRDRGGRQRARTSPSMPTAASISPPRSPTARPCSPTACSGTRSRAIRSTSSSTPCWPSSYAGALATGENLFSAIDGRNLLRYGGMRPDRDWVQLDPGAELRPDRVSAFRRRGGGHGLVAAAAHPARRPSAGAQHRGRPADRRLGELSRRVPALRRLCRRHSDRRRLRAPARDARHRHGAASPRCSPRCASGWSSSDGVGHALASAYDPSPRMRGEGRGEGQRISTPARSQSRDPARRAEARLALSPKGEGKAASLL